jgi:hypothetical protein
VNNQVKPFPTTLDQAALIHDIEYMKPNNQFKADNNMWKNIVKTNPFLLGVANNIRLLFLIKDVLGFKRNDYTNLNVYNDLKRKSKNLINNNMKFADSN